MRITRIRAQFLWYPLKKSTFRFLEFWKIEVFPEITIFSKYNNYLHKKFCSYLLEESLRNIFMWSLNFLTNVFVEKLAIFYIEQKPHFSPKAQSIKISLGFNWSCSINMFIHIPSNKSTVRVFWKKFTGNYINEFFIFYYNYCYRFSTISFCGTFKIDPSRCQNRPIFHEGHFF